MTAPRVQLAATGYRPRRHQKEIHDRLKRFNVLVCHRRFGKTTLCVNALIDAALRARGAEARFAYIAPLATQAKDIAWTTLKRHALPVPGTLAHESEMRVDFPNGARVRLYGGDNPDRLRGLAFEVEARTRVRRRCCVQHLQQNSSQHLQRNRAG